MDGRLPSSLPEGWVLDALPVPAVICDLGGVVHAANDAFVTFAGVSVPAGTHWRAFLDPPDCARLATAAGAALEDDLRGRQRRHHVAVTFRRRGGAEVRAELQLRIATAGSSRLLVATVRELDEHQRQEHRIAVSERRLRALATTVPVGIVSSRAGLRADYANERSAVLFEAEVEDLLGFGWLERLHEDDADGMVEALESVIAEGAERELDVRVPVAGGEHRPVRVRVVPVVAGPDAGFVASFETGELDAVAVAELESEVRTDPLTGLANRRLLWERLVELAGDESVLPAACFVDLDDFKLINDRLGHDAGDHVLRTVADRLRTACRDGDLICRFGGDEFVVLLPHAASQDVALAVGNRIVEAVSRPMALEGDRVAVSVSVGVVWKGSPGVELGADGSELLRAADVALYRAKRLGKNRAAVFDEEARGEGVARRAAAATLHAVIASGGPAVVRHRPIVSLDPVAGDGAGRATVMVEVFVPVGEDEAGTDPDWVAGLAAEAGVATAWEALLLDAAVGALGAGADLSRLRPSLLLAASGPSLTDPLHLDLLAARRAECPLAVAIGERAVVADGRVREGLRRLRAAGLAVVVRGVGGTHSSFASLRSVPFDALELDAGLVDAAACDPTAAAIVAGLAAFAARSGALVLASSVDAPAQLSLLTELGVAAASGSGWHDSAVPTLAARPV